MELKTLRIELDGRWSVRDLGSLLLHLEELYNLRFHLSVIANATNEGKDLIYPYVASTYLRDVIGKESVEFLENRIYLFPERELDSRNARLTIKQIHLSSPGVTDIVGVGNVISHLKDFLFKLLDYKHVRKLQDLEEEEKGIEIRRKAIEAMRLDLLVQQEVREKELRNESLILDNKEKSLKNLALELDLRQKEQEIQLIETETELRLKEAEIQSMKDNVVSFLGITNTSTESLTVLEKLPDVHALIHFVAHRQWVLAQLKTDGKIMRVSEVEDNPHVVTD